MAVFCQIKDYKRLYKSIGNEYYYRVIMQIREYLGRLGSINVYYDALGYSLISPKISPRILTLTLLKEIV